MDISRKILSNPANKWVFGNTGEAYLAGGYIRDLLLGRTPYDMDYAVKYSAKDTALKFAEQFKGTFIELKHELTYRVALRDGQLIDFNNLEDTIEEDLMLRDYTVNAMAWSPDTGIIDPAGGITSVRKRSITAVSRQNLRKDPLRVLRAYRIAAQLNFTIEPETRAYIKKLSNLIATSAPERITEELYKLLNTPDALSYLRSAAEDGVLETIFGLTPHKIKKNLRAIALFDELTKKGFKFNQLNVPISQGLNRAGLIRLALLAKNNSDMPGFDHIRPSNMIKQKIFEIHSALYRYKGRITDARLYQIYRAAGSSVYETALIMSSTRTRRRDRERFIHRADDYQKIKDHDLINGNEIKRILRIKEGAEIGRIKERIKEAQFKGIVTDRTRARQWIISNFT